MVSISDENGTITYANENFYTISGYTKEEVIGKKHNILRHSDIKKDIFKELWKTIKEKKVWHGIIKNRGKNGDYWIDATIVPIVDSNGNIHAAYQKQWHNPECCIHRDRYPANN